MDVREVVQPQYRASLEMLGEAISRCPDSVWDDSGHKNRFWHIAYHTLFFTHLYLQKSEKDFVAWSKHRNEYQFLGPLPWPPHNEPDIGEPYSKEDVLEYLEVCRGEVEEKISSVDWEAESGFHWLRFGKLELQFYNIRHIQHHAGQLADRLRKEGIGIRWVAARQSA